MCPLCVHMRCRLFTLCHCIDETTVDSTLQPTYANHAAHASTYAMLNDPLHTTGVSVEYTDIPDLVATAATSNSLNESQAYETPLPLGDHHKSVLSHTLNSSYLFVPTMVSECETVQQICMYMYGVVACCEQYRAMHAAVTIVCVC